MLLVLCFSLAASRARAAGRRRSEEAVQVTHDDAGFRIATLDEQNELRVFGIVQADLRNYLRKSDRTDYERFLVRRARAYIEGHVAGAVGYRLMIAQPLPLGGDAAPRLSHQESLGVRTTVMW